MNTLRALIIDDEPLARSAIREALTPEDAVEVVGELGDGAAAVTAIRRHRPDLVFLDVQMPGMDGFGVLSSLPADELPAVVFVTAFDQFAIRAFEVHAVDYLLKPFDDARLRSAVEQARARIAAEQFDVTRQRLGALLEDLAPSVRAGGEGTASGRRAARRVLVRDGDESFRFVRLDEVRWVEAAGNNVRFHTATGVHEIRMTLRSLVPQLDGAVFRRIHRSTVVNVNAVKEIQPWFAGDCLVLLHDGEKLRMSRTYRAEFLQVLS